MLVCDHDVGYLYFNWHTTFVSVPSPVSLVSSDMAMEDYNRDEKQRLLHALGAGEQSEGKIA